MPDRSAEPAESKSRRIWNEFRQDLKLGARSLFRTPGFSLVAIIILGLGVGMNTALFSIIDAVLLRPLPYPEPDRLVRLFDSNDRREERNQVTPADLKDWQTRQQAFTGVAGWSCQGFALATTPPEQVQGRCVSTNYFDVLGVTLPLGRGFRPDEARPGQGRVVIFTDGLWRTHFNADPGVLGREVNLNGETHTVVGVLPPGFGAVDQFGARDPVQVFVPLMFSDKDLADRGSHNFDVVARLKPDVSMARAQADMDAVAKTLTELYPGDNTGRGVLVTSLNQEVVRDVRMSLLALSAAVALILLLACANVANLMLTRAVGQQREVAVRIALGAGRLRIVRGLLTQNLVLALIGGGFGVFIAYWALFALRRIGPASVPHLDQIQLNGRVLGFTLAISLVTGLLFGVFPALHASGIRPYESLERRGRGAAGSAVLRWRDLLMIGQVAIALILLLTAGLLLKSFGALRGVELGYQADRVMAMRMFLPRVKYPDPASRVTFYDRVSERVATLPGVEFVAFASNLPLRGGWGGNFTLEHAIDPAKPDYQASFQLVSPDYFRALAVPLRQGRMFTTGDRAGTLPVVIVNETTAQRLWPQGNAVGSRLKKGGPTSNTPWRTVVGVVGDVKLQGPARPTPLEIYYPSGQFDGLGISPSELVVRTAGEPQTIVAAARRQIWDLDAEQPVSRVETLGASVTTSVAQPRFNALLLLVFASLAVVLALLGIYGVVAYAVTQRTAEMGLRLALGAQPGDLVHLVLRRVLGMVFVGIALGTIGAYAGARLVERLLFGVPPHDPATFASVLILLTLAALAASYIPARRIVRVDPVIALRYD